mgnify:CR=1 FL=1
MPHDSMTDGYFDPSQHDSYDHFLRQREDPFTLPLASGLSHVQAQLCRFNARVHSVDAAYFENGDYRVHVEDLRNFKGHTYLGRHSFQVNADLLDGIANAKAGAVISFTARIHLRNPADVRFRLKEVNQMRLEWQPESAFARLADTQRAH